MQTESRTVREVGVSDRWDDPSANVRGHELQLGFPKAEDFPVLTTSQLADAERRIKAILLKIEREIRRCEDEDAALANGADDGSRKDVLRVTDEWNREFRKAIDRRLLARRKQGAM